MAWVIGWVLIGLIGSYFGTRRAMVRMGARFPGLYEDPVECWREEFSSGLTWGLILLMSLFGPFSSPMMLMATYLHERGLSDE